MFSFPTEIHGASHLPIARAWLLAGEEHRTFTETE
jgi:hypothetical protein